MRVRDTIRRSTRVGSGEPRMISAHSNSHTASRSAPSRRRRADPYSTGFPTWTEPSMSPSATFALRKTASLTMSPFTQTNRIRDLCLVSSSRVRAMCSMTSSGGWLVDCSRPITLISRVVRPAGMPVSCSRITASMVIESISSMKCRCRRLSTLVFV